MNKVLLLSLSILLISCKSEKTGNNYIQNKIDFLDEMAEFMPNGDFEQEILFQTITKDQEDIEIFGDTLIPWVSIENAVAEIPILVGKQEIVVESQSAILVIDYPVEKPIEIKLTSKSPNGFTREDLLTQISEHYKRIYREEQESSHVAVTPIEEREIMNRNTTNGKYGIWGHDLIDLDLSGIEVRKNGDKTYLYLYVES